jgi:hypothetical protein
VKALAPTVVAGQELFRDISVAAAAQEDGGKAVEAPGDAPIPTAVAMRRAWKMRSWDRFEIPKPFSRVHFVIGDPVWVDRDLPRRHAPVLAKRLQSVMFNLEKQARAFLGIADHDQETQV